MHLRYTLGIPVVLIAAVAMGEQTSAPEPPKLASRSERHAWILNTLMPHLEQFRQVYHNVPRSDGDYLRWIIMATKRKRALEIGSANGYSALWLGLGLEETGGRLTTIEIDPKRAQEAKANLQRAGLERVVTAVEGDALKVVPTLKGQFDFAFIDIGSKALPFFEVVEPKLTDEAIVAVHRPPFEGALRDYLDAIKQRPEWLTTTIQTGAPTGIVLSIRFLQK